MKGLIRASAPAGGGLNQEQCNQFNQPLDWDIPLVEDMSASAPPHAQSCVPGPFDVLAGVRGAAGTP